MKKTILTALAAAAAVTAAASPALAQSYGYDRGDRYERRHEGEFRRDDRGVRERLARLEQRIERSADRGRLSPHEATRLHQEVRELARLDYRLRRDGLSYREHAHLIHRLDRLEARFRHEREDRDYGHGYGRDGWR